MFILCIPEEIIVMIYNISSNFVLKIYGISSRLRMNNNLDESSAYI